MTQSSQGALEAIRWLAEQRPAMEEALKTLVNTESFSLDKAGTDRVAAIMQRWLRSAGVDAVFRGEAEHGDVLEASLPGAAGPVVLLMGHRDTVFPTGTVAERPYTVKGRLAFGPGVADMKAGLVLQCFVLMALKRLPSLPFPVVAAFTADEEKGSAIGRKAIEALGKRVRAAFNAEPGRISGNLVAARKGGASFLIRVSGKAAHSGINHADGRSAIEVLARVITSIHALTDYAVGVTTNVGVIRGGTTHNTVAATAEAELDVRFCTHGQRDQLFARLREIAAHEFLPDCRVELVQLAESMPLEPANSEDLMRRYRQQAAALGFDVDGEFTGGCSDAGIIASFGVPTLCGVGPVGGKAHTADEFCDLDTLVPRAQALLATILDLAN